MRRGYENGWLLNTNGDLVGINLGADFTAEHEWGIDDIKCMLGVPQSKRRGQRDEEEVNYQGVYGIDRRRCANPDKDCILLKEEKDILNLVVCGKHTLKCFAEEGVENRSSSEYAFRDHRSKNQDMVTAWSGSGFIIRVEGEKNHKKLRRLHEALVNGKCAIWLGGGGVFKNGGLCIAIIDQINEENLKTMRDCDIDYEKMRKAASATGIRKKLRDADEQWRKMREVETGSHCYESKWNFYALSPQWANSEYKKKTKHSIVFWLNPMNQTDNNYGYFTVEELEQWLENKGPIPKTEEEKRKSR